MKAVGSNLNSSITFLSDKCEIHDTEMMDFRGQAICFKCGLEWEDAHLMNRERDKYLNSKRMEKYNMLKRDSLVPDETLKQATFETYEPKCQETQANKQLAMDYAERYRNGEVFNIIMQGNQGAGKSHLSYSILEELNETSNYKTASLFISISDMMYKIRDSFSNKETKYTEDYLITLLSKPDFLVLDDLGAESGAIDTTKQATDFVQRVLYAVTSTRQGKATILTSNLSSEAMFGMYDKKLVSRLLSKPKFIVFKTAKDNRMSSIPF